MQLLEFLMASLCLYLNTSYGPGAPVTPAPNIYTFSRALGDRPHKTWWTVAVEPPEPDPTVSALMDRVLSLLVATVRLTLIDAWKSMQLSIVTIWNISGRAAFLEKACVLRNVVSALIQVSCDHVAMRASFLVRQ